MYTFCTSIVREGDRDRYLATLLAPEDVRYHLFVLYAFNLEVRSILEKVSDPFAGYIRLQWWRDTLALVAHGGMSGSPVADLLQNTIEEKNLPFSKLQKFVEAQEFELSRDVFFTEEDLWVYLDQTFGVILECACMILVKGENYCSSALVKHASSLSGLIWILSFFPTSFSRWKSYIPQTMFAKYGINRESLSQDDHESHILLTDALLEEADKMLVLLNRELSSTPSRLWPAFAHLASIRSDLKTLRSSCTVGQAPRFRSPLYRQWRIWRFMSGYWKSL